MTRFFRRTGTKSSTSIRRSCRLFPGIDAIGQAYRAGVKVAGITVHYVDEGMDTGPIIAQRALELDQHETLDSLEEKIHKLEHELYPEVIKELLELNGRGEKK